jgi:hypothetical protein
MGVIRGYDQPTVNQQDGGGGGVIGLDGNTVTHNGTSTKLIVNGAARSVRVGCHTVSFAALERIYALYRRHRDAAKFEAQG